MADKLAHIDAVLTELRNVWREIPESERDYIMVRIDAWLDKRHRVISTA